MRNHSKKNFVPYLFSFLFVGLLAGLYVGLRDFSSQPLVEKYRMLCDAFTIPGVILILVGSLVLLSDSGAFHGIGYVLSYAKNTLLHFVVPGALGNTETYFDYVERKKAEGRMKNYVFLFVAGGLSMFISFVFMFLFYQLY